MLACMILGYLLVVAGAATIVYFANAFVARQFDYLLGLIVHHAVHIPLVVMFVLNVAIGTITLPGSLIIWALHASGVY